MSNGKLVKDSLVDFMRNEPNNEIYMGQSENCLEFTNSKLFSDDKQMVFNDKYCTAQNNFICEERNDIYQILKILL